MVGDDLGDNYWKWMSGAVADDGCFYCFPYQHNRIVKSNPNDDTTIFVGVEGYFKFSGTIKAKNGCLYGPFSTNRVVKFNVNTQKVTFIVDECEGKGKWESGVEGMDGNMYGVPYRHDKWLKIDIVTETTSLVGDDLSTYGRCKYSCGVFGEDCNLYVIPADTNKVQDVSEVGCRYDGYKKWSEVSFTRMGIYIVHHCAIIKH